MFVPIYKTFFLFFYMNIYCNLIKASVLKTRTQRALRIWNQISCGAAAHKFFLSRKILVDLFSSIFVFLYTFLRVNEREAKGSFVHMYIKISTHTLTNKYFYYFYFKIFEAPQMPLNCVLVRWARNIIFFF